MSDQPSHNDYRDDRDGHGHGHNINTHHSDSFFLDGRLSSATMLLITNAYVQAHRQNLQ